MTDVHVHLERGPYTRAWVDCFVETALARGLGSVWLLEHTHRFVEFAPLYREAAARDPRHAAWLARKGGLRLSGYAAFVSAMKRESFPIELRWGLEVCHVPGNEDLVRSLTEGGPFDFLTGSVHWIDGWGFDHGPEYWEGQDVDAAWLRHAELSIDLAESGLYHVIAHPDSIKCFGFLPSEAVRGELAGRHARLARALRERGMAAEVSAGLANNYGRPGVGMEPCLLGAMRDADVELVTASDAHRPEDVGLRLKECQAAMLAP
jgi:histidinol-phosphatase (PHP family)